MDTYTWKNWKNAKAGSRRSDGLHLRHTNGGVWHEGVMLSGWFLNQGNTTLAFIPERPLVEAQALVDEKVTGETMLARTRLMLFTCVSCSKDYLVLGNTSVSFTRCPHCDRATRWPGHDAWLLEPLPGQQIGEALSHFDYTAEERKAIHEEDMRLYNLGGGQH